MSRKITLAYEYVDPDGKTHDPDTTLSVDDAEAVRLLHYGLAREPDTSKSATAEKKG